MSSSRHAWNESAHDGRGRSGRRDGPVLIDPVESRSAPGRAFRYRPGGILRRSGRPGWGCRGVFFVVDPEGSCAVPGGPGRGCRGMLFVIDPMGSCAAGVAGSGRTCPVCFRTLAASGAGYAPFGSRRRFLYVMAALSIPSPYRRLGVKLQEHSGKNTQ